MLYLPEPFKQNQPTHIPPHISPRSSGKPPPKLPKLSKHIQKTNPTTRGENSKSHSKINREKHECQKNKLAAKCKRREDSRLRSLTHANRYRLRDGLKHHFPGTHAWCHTHTHIHTRAHAKTRRDNLRLEKMAPPKVSSAKIMKNETFA